MAEKIEVMMMLQETLSMVEVVQWESREFEILQEKGKPWELTS